jgi:uncharacterized MAPEG superfamily protein
MTTPLWCLLFVLFLPYIMIALSSKYRKAQFGHYDNNHPRAQCQQLTGRGARVWAAHLNALEARALFASAVIVAHMLGADPFYSTVAAVVFVTCRILHAVFYINDQAVLRTAAFAIGQACCLSLFILAAISA